MIYQIIANGTYNNIKFITMNDTISVLLKCTGCGTNHKNAVTLTSSSIKIDKGGNKWNLIIKCIECEHKMKLSIKPIIKYSENNLKEFNSSEIFYPEKGPNCYILGEITCDMCNIIDIPGISIKVYSFSGEKYIPEDLISGTPWIIFEKNKKISIEEFQLEFKLIK